MCISQQRTNNVHFANWTKPYFKIFFEVQEGKVVCNVSKNPLYSTLTWLMDLLKCCSRGVRAAPLKGPCKCTRKGHAGSP